MRKVLKKTRSSRGVRRWGALRPSRTPPLTIGAGSMGPSIIAPRRAPQGVGKFRFRHDGRLDAKPLLARVVATPCRIKVQLLVDTLACDWQDDREPLGIDVGIAKQVTLSDGTQYPSGSGRCLA